MLLIYENKEAVEVEIGCNQCASCKECIKACNYGVLEGVDDTPIVVNPSSCVVYLECEKSCPAGEIGAK
jgi:NAD-dependent dihydropyrimidine dehydrogenase PreA subunit